MNFLQALAVYEIIHYKCNKNAEKLEIMDINNDM
jgi:hypothetical protein